MGGSGAGGNQAPQMVSPFRADCVAGRVALVTGGGSGIGLEIATQLGLHGARVCVMGRREAVLKEAVVRLQSHGIRAVWYAGDVRKKDDAVAAVKTTADTFGRLDILVNCAAGNFLAAAESMSSNAFRTVLDIDAVGTFNMCLAARPFLQRNHHDNADDTVTAACAGRFGGAIVNISATLHYSSSWYQAHVMAAKAAVDATTRSLALEWGTDYGIRSNTVAPGPIGDTPGMAKLAPKEIGLDATQYIPLGRMGLTWDIAMAVLYLCSDAGQYLNGANLVVDGGNWLFRPRLVDKKLVSGLSRAIEERSRKKNVQTGPVQSRL